MKTEVSKKHPNHQQSPAGYPGARIHWDQEIRHQLQDPTSYILYLGGGTQTISLKRNKRMTNNDECNDNYEQDEMIGNYWDGGVLLSFPWSGKAFQRVVMMISVYTFLF